MKKQTPKLAEIIESNYDALGPPITGLLRMRAQIAGRLRYAAMLSKMSDAEFCAALASEMKKTYGPYSSKDVAMVLDGSRGNLGLPEIAAMETFTGMEILTVPRR